MRRRVKTRKQKRQCKAKRPAKEKLSFTICESAKPEDLRMLRKFRNFAADREK